MNTFIKVNDQKGIEAVAKLAHAIWNQHFVPIIGQAQVDYMLDQFQSAEALAAQLSQGYEYYIISRNDTGVGYLGLLPEENTGRMMISKFYIQKEARGLGVGSHALHFVKELSKQRSMDTLWLKVNRYNEDTIRWYLKKGFVVVEEVKKDIGQGFFMDDYIMELTNDQSMI